MKAKELIKLLHDRLQDLHHKDDVDVKVFMGGEFHEITRAFFIPLADSLYIGTDTKAKH